MVDIDSEGMHLMVDIDSEGMPMMADDFAKLLEADRVSIERYVRFRIMSRVDAGMMFCRRSTWRHTKSFRSSKTANPSSHG